VFSPRTGEGETICRVGGKNVPYNPLNTPPGCRPLVQIETRSGIMPPIELGPALPVGAVNTTALRAATGGSARTEKTAAPAPGPSSGVVTSDALDPGSPPIDTDRINMIRKAVETGTYPVVPAKVADAMIAAGMLLRTSK
jgi:negative regulator of flagellin synthesis FlgM